jgi:hypothetical protein
LSTDCSSCITGGLNGLVTNTTDFSTLLQTYTPRLITVQLADEF